ncbi:hypothetical protein, partial [Phenylobacterium sp.]|uniref:hypothetical protein n=1 Tax=Phenylobacterium sp. TaxID=1871053 RepID=UPI0025F33191
LLSIAGILLVIGGFLIIFIDKGPLPRDVGMILVASSAYFVRTAVAGRRTRAPDSKVAPASSQARRIPIVGASIGIAWVASAAFLLSRGPDDAAALYGIYALVGCFVASVAWAAYYFLIRGRW